MNIRNQEHLYTALIHDERRSGSFLCPAVIGEPPPRDSSYAEQKKAGAILKKSSLSCPIIRGWLITSSMLPTTNAGQTARWQAARSYARLHFFRITLCTCRLISSFKVGSWAKKLSRQSRLLAAPVLGWPGPGRKELWDQHGPRQDYLAYAYLQTGQDQLARNVPR